MLTNETENDIKARLDAQTEWLLIRSSGESFALRKSEIELETTNNKLVFGFLDEKGFRARRVFDCEFKKNEIVLHLTGNFGKRLEKVRLVPRVSAAELSAATEAARLEKANLIARAVTQNFPRAKLVRVELNEENGRFARIVFEKANGEQIAALADVSGTLTPESLLSTSLLWLSKLSGRKKNPVRTVCIISESKTTESLAKIRALLNEKWKNKIELKAVFYMNGESQNAEALQSRVVLEEAPELKISDLWREKAKAMRRFGEKREISRAAQAIIELAPAETDVVCSRNGETLRFFGLPFARVRKFPGGEKLWFGVEKKQMILTENNRQELLELVDNLKTYRRFDSPNRRHALFQMSAEAWLEAIFRRNIKLLDANLILSPLYHQFRAEQDKIDLLALRKDGRLTIIEVKTAPDREMIFQAADYWRKVELQRRSGNLHKTRLFSGLEMADKPAIVYLVAPTLCFHRDFDFLAGTIAPEIEIHRFNLAENWREKLKVSNRKRI